MPKLLTGFTENTPQRLQLNAGVLLKNYTKGGTIAAEDIITATRGGGSFSATPTIHNVAVDGVPTNVKGLERVDEWVVELTTTAIECTAETIKRALGVGVTATSETGGKTKITASDDIKSDDYQDIWWVGDRSDGTKVEIKIKNALSMGGLSLAFSDKGEGTIGLTLRGHYDIDDLSTAPFEIYIDDGVSGT